MGYPVMTGDGPPAAGLSQAEERRDGDDDNNQADDIDDAVHGISFA
jgi:hypothetical protein